MVELIHFRPDSVTIPQCDLEQSTRLLLSLPLHVNGTGGGIVCRQVRTQAGVDLENNFAHLGVL